MKVSVRIVLIFLLWPVSLMAQSEGSKKEGSAADSPTMEEAMAAYMKLAEPGEHHAMLNPMAGEWVVETKFRMGPDGEWQPSSSEASIDWVLGGRFLKQEVSSPPSEFMPVPFEGLGYLGFDNYKKEYVSVWMDTFATMVLVTSGEGGDNAVTLDGHYADPMSGKQKSHRWAYKIHDDDHFSLMMYDEGPDGNLYVQGELHYHRKKD